MPQNQWHDHGIDINLIQIWSLSWTLHTKLGQISFAQFASTTAPLLCLHEPIAQGLPVQKSGELSPLSWHSHYCSSPLFSSLTSSHPSLSLCESAWLTTLTHRHSCAMVSLAMSIGTLGPNVVSSCQYCNIIATLRLQCVTTKAVCITSLVPPTDIM